MRHLLGEIGLTACGAKQRAGLVVDGSDCTAINDLVTCDQCKASGANGLKITSEGLKTAPIGKD